MMNLGVPLMKTNIYIGYLLQKMFENHCTVEEPGRAVQVSRQDSPPSSFPFRKKEVSGTTNFLPAVFLCLTPIQWEGLLSIVVCWILLEFRILLPSRHME